MFGSKDVDLRMELPQGLIRAPTPPPPPMISSAPAVVTDEKLGWAVIKVILIVAFYFLSILFIIENVNNCLPG